MLPEVGKMLEKKTGYKSFVYGNFSRDRTKWETYGQTPRYSTQYVGMRGRIGILSESYSYAPYKDRIIASREFVRAWLEYVAAHKDEIRKLLADNDQGREIAVRTNSTTLRKTTALGYEEEMKDGRRVPLLEKPRDFELEVVTRVEPAEKVEKPYAYLFPASYKSAVTTLLLHGIAVEELKEDASVPAESYVLGKIDKAARAFQKHNEVNVVTTANGPAQQRTMPAGTIVVRTAQPLGVFASYLLEPRSEDGLTTWNFFDEGLAPEREFPVVRLPKETPMKLGPVRLPAENSRNSP
jgi:hypothetical protein